VLQDLREAETLAGLRWRRLAGVDRPSDRDIAIVEKVTAWMSPGISYSAEAFGPISGPTNPISDQAAASGRAFGSHGRLDENQSGPLSPADENLAENARNPDIVGDGRHCGSAAAPKDFRQQTQVLGSAFALVRKRAEELRTHRRCKVFEQLDRARQVPAAQVN
jgi:hypothetical protein